MANTKVKAEQLEAAQTNITSVGTLSALTVSGDLTVDTSTLKVDSSNNRVGIGTASPSSRFHIYEETANTNTYSNVMRLESRSSGTTVAGFGGAIYFLGERNGDGALQGMGRIISLAEVNSGTTLSSGMAFHTATAGTPSEKLRITHDGNVSIGNSSVAFPSGEGLQVYSSGNPRIKLANSTTGVASGDGTQFYLDGADVIYDNKDAGNQRWYTGGAERVRIDNSGNVGIGTTNPKRMLQVGNNTQAIAALSLQTTTSGLSRIYMGDNDGTSAEYAGMISYAHSDNSMQFFTGGNERVRITSSGFVGINDTAPPRRLSIIGEDGAYSGQTSGNSRTHILLENNGGNYIEFINPSGSSCGLMFSTNTAQNRGSIQYSSDALYLTQGGYDRAIIRPDGAFQTSDTNALIDFDSGGNRVRNASVWGYTLRHEGTGSNPHGLLVYYASGAPDNSSSYPIYFTDSSAARFYVTSAGNIWTSDHGTITSDETLKENIVDATPKLADIMKLKVRNFNWKKSYHPNSSEKMLGFIAQEFEEVFPSLVKESDIAPKTSAKNDEDHEPNMKKSVVAGALIPALVKAMQEQQALIETLQAEVKALKGG